MTSPATAVRKPLDTIVVTTGDTIEYSVIWLHGLGASGHDFEPIVPELKLLKRPGVRFLFPHAPVRPISINGGAAMRGWYDITSLDFDQREQDEEGTCDSAEQISDLIEREIDSGIAASNIILAGFSQGGAIALYTALTSKHKLGGVMALSTYLPLPNQALANAAKTKGLPIFMAHGQYDETINIAYAERSLQALRDAGFGVEWHTYPIPHSVSSEEVNDIADWLKRLFGM